MARSQRHDAASAHQFLLFLLLRLLLLLPSAKAASFSTLCGSTPPLDLPIAKQHSQHADLAHLPSITAGHFSGSGGRDLRFARDRPYTRALTLHPRESSARATTDPAATHLSATLTLDGTRLGWRDDDYEYEGARRLPHSVSFDLDGYYYTNNKSTSTAELCMVGSGSYAREDGTGVVVLSDVVLRLHLPRPASLSRPFVTGTVAGADFRPISLLAYADDDYAYGGGEAASCPEPPVPVRAARQALRSGQYSCHHLRALLRSSYSLDYSSSNEHDGASSSNNNNSFPLRLRHVSMNVNQMRCADDGAVRAYMVFYANESEASPPPSNYTALRRRTFAIGDEALVADGFWDPKRSQLCLRACRVVASSSGSGKARAEADVQLRVRECGIGVRFWFPAVWSIRDRRVAAGMIWNNTSGNTASGSGVISVSRTGSYRGGLDGISYNYTRVEEARKHYYDDDAVPALSKERKGGRLFPGNYSYRDFTFQFNLEKTGLPGYAWPVTIGSAVVEVNEMMADETFAAAVNKQSLLNVSYNLEYRVASANNGGKWQRMSAEGVYDTQTGSLCLVACQVTNGTSDCDILVTFQFAPVNSVETERSVGTIRSLRKPGDPLFFEAMDIVAEGVYYVIQREESMSRMDMESIMLVVSMSLSCVFTALQLRHVSKHPEALPATSVTMLVVLALGYVVPLVFNLEDMYTDTRRRYILQLTTAGSLDLNEFMLRASTMLALVLQLRLLQLALSRRSSTDRAGSKHEEDSSSSSSSSSSSLLSDAERSTLWICLPLYVLGAVVVWIVHMSDGHHLHVAPRASSAFSVAANATSAEPALVDDLAAYAGLILDGFLLPQVVSNAFSGSRARALSPWFYAGGTVIRAAPHAYDVFRKRNYVTSWNWKPTTYVYASPRDDLFGVAWDVAIPCGATLLAGLLFLQQWLGGAFLCCLKSRRSDSGEYEMVSTATISF